VRPPLNLSGKRDDIRAAVDIKAGCRLRAVKEGKGEQQQTAPARYLTSAAN
jgi:hypothetical protein